MKEQKLSKLCCGGICSLFSSTSDKSELNQEEIQRIREMWNRAKNEEVGRKILATIIDRRPKFAEYFGIVCNVDEELDMANVHKNRAFQLQAHRIQGFFDTVINSLGYCPISTVNEMARHIGQIHYYKGINFDANNWLVFKRSVIDSVMACKSNGSKKSSTLTLNKEESDHSSDNTVCNQAWNKLVSVVVREMKRGFLEEAMKNCREEESPSV